MTVDEAVRCCRNGDHEASATWWHATALLMTRNPVIAEEHVQDALLLAWRGIRRLPAEYRRSTGPGW